MTTEHSKSCPKQGKEAEYEINYSLEMYVCKSCGAPMGGKEEAHAAYVAVRG